MKASEWLKTIPEHPGPEREAAMLQAVADDIIMTVVWSPVMTSAHGNTILLWVGEDALRVGKPGDSVRITMSCRTAQQIADYLDARLPTLVVSDKTWEAATVRVPAMPQPWWKDGTMSLTSRMSEYSRLVDEHVAGKHGLVADVGKDWVLCSGLVSFPAQAANYGFRKLNGIPWQPLGFAHNLEHVDYSQVFRPVCRVAELNGVRVPYDDVVRLLGSPVAAHPGVPHSSPIHPLADPP